jgi:hypothetical protein
VAPLNPYEKMSLGVLVPLVMLGELLVTALAARVFHWISNRNSSSGGAAPRFDWNPWMRSCVAMFLFSYYQVSRRFPLRSSRCACAQSLRDISAQVATTTIRYLHCVPVGEDWYVFSSPAIKCYDSKVI